MGKREDVQNFGNMCYSFTEFGLDEFVYVNICSVQMDYTLATLLGTPVNRMQFNAKMLRWKCCIEVHRVIQVCEPLTTEFGLEQSLCHIKHINSRAS